MRWRWRGETPGARSVSVFADALACTVASLGWTRCVWYMPPADVTR